MIWFNNKKPNNMVFESGAVRESEDDKLNPSYVPLDVIEYVMDNVAGQVHEWGIDNINIVTYQMLLKEPQTLCEALCLDVYHLLRSEPKSYQAMLLVFNEGAKKYAPNNWRMGFPLDRTMNSLVRHASAYLADNDDLYHLGGYLANMLFIIYTIGMKKDVN